MGSHEKDPPKYPIPCNKCEGRGVITADDKKRLTDLCLCDGCGNVDDNYMVTKSTWSEAGFAYKTKRCLNCLQTALGRPLTFHDFVGTPANRALQFGYFMGLAHAATHVESMRGKTMTHSFRKFYKTTYTLVILSEEKVPSDMEAADLVEEMSTGSYSGRFKQESEEVVDGPTMATLLQEQASDPSFFNLTSDGKDADEG
jgi:hypothetical protein